VVSRIEGYWIAVVAPQFTVLQEFTTDPFRPGTNVYASISLSEVNTLFEANAPNPRFAASAWIMSWTFYRPDGSESRPQSGGPLFTQNAVGVDNCARITFALAGQRVAATAQINIFTF
jgi:hypothetical protein